MWLLVRLGAFLGGGPWTWTPVEVERWGRSSASGVVTLPDGTTRRITFPYVSFQEVEHVRHTGGIWFAGPPHAGHTCAVGVPGHLPLTFAVIG